MAATTLIDRALLRLSGEDVRGFLQGLVTNDLALLAPATPLWAGLLSAQGKALFDFILWADGDDVLIDCEADQAEALRKRLSLYRLRRAITIARDETARGALVARRRAACRIRACSELGHRWLAPADDAAEGWLAHRLSLGVTEGVAELGADKTLWLEANAAELNGVSFTKGCYVGQENTARMNYRSKVNRRLVVVPLASADDKRAARRLSRARPVGRASPDRRSGRGVHSALARRRARGAARLTRRIAMKFMPHAALLALATLSACATPGAQQPQGGGKAPTTFVTGLNQPVVAEGRTITPVEIVEDSRCPTNVTCIQAGTVRLAVRVQNALYPVGLKKPADIGGRWLHLIDVCPYPRQPQSIAPNAYRFRFALDDDAVTETPQSTCAV